MNLQDSEDIPKATKVWLPAVIWDNPRVLLLKVQEKENRINYPQSIAY